MLTFAQFQAHVQSGRNFIPLYQELIADLDTPVSAWYRVCQGQPYSFLLESVEGGERMGRYSLLGCDPLWILESRGDRTTQTWRDGRQQVHRGNPFNIVAGAIAPIAPLIPPDLPPTLGGLIGYWGYELIRWIEPRVPVYAPQDEDVPDGIWMQMDSLLVFDQVQRKIWAIAYGDLVTYPDAAVAYRQAQQRLTALLEKLRLPHPVAPMAWVSPADRPAITYESNFTAAQFTAAVITAKDHIRQGDIFQVVLSQRLSTPFSGDPFTLYRSLRVINPSPYMAFLHFQTWQLIGSSPEVLVKAERHDNTRCTLRPIAGTRPRGRTVAEDQALALELLADPKETAEHIMLVDLGRNDLGRVCDNGSVHVDELMIIERYSHVMHIVSNVIGTLSPKRTPWDLLQACFPAGTVSGAPKIRAMEILHTLEGDRRGAYSGAYGYYDFAGQLNTAITIRTMVVQNGRVSVQAGAGIVADSDPHTEYQETLNKAKGMLEAIRCLCDS
ncbi:MAG: anthranilate synthase component I [Oscillatoriales cyanobacterium SM2_2_1]|nr:anthranilate synthase component I [Oscillatoriales cyanobacterium SM2_2_1]